MNEPTNPGRNTDPIGSDETLSAYLAGELDSQQELAFEARLATEPQLAAQLDSLANALVALAGADTSQPPAGFVERLEARLAAEATVADLDAARQRRNRKLAPLLSAAAGLVLVIFAGVQVLQPSSDDTLDSQLAMDGDDESADMAAEGFAEASLESSSGASRLSESYEASDMMMAPAPPEQDSGNHKAVERSMDGGGSASGTSGDTADSPAATDMQVGVVVAEDGAAFTHDDELLAHFQGRAEAERLRGMPRDEASETALRHVEQIHEAAPFSSGTHPSSCLDSVRAGKNARIVARVERIVWKGEDAIAYLVAAPSDSTVDRYELLVTAVDACAVRRQLDWK